MVWALNLAPVPMDAAGARRAEQPNSACAFVLVGLANHAGPDGRDAFPGVDTLVRYTRLSERTVRTALDRLEDKGTIKPCDPDVLAAKIKRADRRPNGYDLCMDLVRDDLDTEALRGISKANPFLKPLIEQVIEQRGATTAPRESEPQERGATAAPRESERGAIGAERGATASERGAGVAPEPSLTALEPSGTPSTAAAGAPTGRLSATVIASTSATSTDLDLFLGSEGIIDGEVEDDDEPDPDAEHRRTVQTLVAAYAEVVTGQNGGHLTDAQAKAVGSNVKRILKNDKISPEVLLVAVRQAAARGEKSIDRILAAPNGPQASYNRSPAARRAMYDSWLAMGRKLDEARAAKAGAA
jgi:hypothetical protein